MVFLYKDYRLNNCKSIVFHPYQKRQACVFIRQFLFMIVLTTYLSKQIRSYDILFNVKRTIRFILESFRYKSRWFYYIDKLLNYSFGTSNWYLLCFMKIWRRIVFLYIYLVYLLCKLHRLNLVFAKVERVYIIDWIWNSSRIITVVKFFCYLHFL